MPSPASSTDRSRFAGSVAVGFATLLFSWGLIIAKVVALPAPVLASLRLVVGGLVLTAVALVFRVRWPQLKGAVVVAGLAFGVHQMLYMGAVQRTSVAVVALVGATMPLIVSFSSRRTVGEAVPRGLLVCAALAVAGVALVVHGSLGAVGRSLLGDVLAVGNVVAASVYFLATKRARLSGAPTLTLTASMFWIALAVTGSGVLFTGFSAPTSADWLWITVLALGPGNGHLLVNWAHQRISAALSSLILSMLPGLAAVWAFLVLGEPFTVWHLAGLALVTAAVEVGRRLDARQGSAEGRKGQAAP